MRYGMVEKYISDYSKVPSPGMHVFEKKTVCIIAFCLVAAQGLRADDRAEEMAVDLSVRTSFIAMDADEIATMSGEAAGLVQTAFALNMVTFGFGVI
jgi:hypothetical protein